MAVQSRMQRALQVCPMAAEKAGQHVQHLLAGPSHPQVYLGIRSKMRGDQERVHAVAGARRGGGGVRRGRGRGKLLQQPRQHGPHVLTRQIVGGSQELQRGL